jgi:hypothetical protein
VRDADLREAGVTYKPDREMMLAEIKKLVLASNVQDEEDELGIVSKRCEYKGCLQKALYGSEKDCIRKYCIDHKKDGHIDVSSFMPVDLPDSEDDGGDVEDDSGDGEDDSGDGEERRGRQRSR